MLFIICYHKNIVAGKAGTTAFRLKSASFVYAFANEVEYFASTLNSFPIFRLMNLPDQPPRFFRSWNQFYWFVAVWLALLIFLFWLFTLHFS